MMYDEDSMQHYLDYTCILGTVLQDYRVTKNASHNKLVWWTSIQQLTKPTSNAKKPHDSESIHIPRYRIGRKSLGVVNVKRQVRGQNNAQRS